MTIAEAIDAHTSVRVWHASGDSRVGIAHLFLDVEGVKIYAVQLLNQPNLKFLQMGRNDLNRDWLLAPRVAVKWMNVGSVWVRHQDHKFWNRPVPLNLRVEVYEPITNHGTVRYRARGAAKDKTLAHHSSTCHDFMWQYTRLWGAEVAKGSYPTEPLPFQAKKLPGRPKKPKPVPLSAMDRLLEKDLIPE